MYKIYETIDINIYDNNIKYDNNNSIKTDNYNNNKYILKTLQISNNLVQAVHNRFMAVLEFMNLALVTYNSYTGCLFQF